MLDHLTAGQWADWEQFHQQFHLAFDRDDLLWGVARADFQNANKGENEQAVHPYEVMPYYDQFAEEITAEELLQRIGIRPRNSD